MGPSNAPAIIQARLSSSRLPGKVLRRLAGVTVVEHVVRRARGFSEAVIVATSTDPSDDELARFLHEKCIPCVRGPLDDVYGRFVAALASEELKGTSWFYRVTADCPLLSEALARLEYDARSDDADVIYFDDLALPRGIAPELVRTEAFLSLNAEPMTKPEREHVTLGLYRRSPERAKSLIIPEHLRWPEFRLTLDYQEDHTLLCQLFDNEPTLTAERAVEILAHEPALAALNQHCQTAVFGSGT